MSPSIKLVSKRNLEEGSHAKSLFALLDFTSGVVNYIQHISCACALLTVRNLIKLVSKRNMEVVW